MTIRIPDSLRDAEINIGVDIPQPEIRMEKRKDGSISLSAYYDMCDISEFAWRVANELNDDIEKALIENLLELNGYIKERTCRNVAVEGVLFECSECGAKTVDAVGNYTQEYCAACGRRVQDAD